MGLTFKAGQLIFDKYKRLSFCPNCKCFGGVDGDPAPCAWPTGITLPSCVVVRKTDFTGCVACVDTQPSGDLPIVLYLGTEIYETNPADKFRLPSTNAMPLLKVYAVIGLNTVDCTWFLAVRCTNGVATHDIWYGEKDGGLTPLGTYLRISGCDTSYQLTVN